MTEQDFLNYMQRNTRYKSERLQRIISKANKQPDTKLALVQAAAEETDTPVNVVLEWVSWWNHRVLEPKPKKEQS